MLLQKYIFVSFNICLSFESALRLGVTHKCTLQTNGQNIFHAEYFLFFLLKIVKFYSGRVLDSPHPFIGDMPLPVPLAGGESLFIRQAQFPHLRCGN